jgi:hypothetical protein
MNAPERYSAWRYEDEDEADKLVYQPGKKQANLLIQTLFLPISFQGTQNHNTIYHS